jgi:hypothetical protein
MWPAFVMDEAHANACDGLETAPREGAIAVQFFGSHDYARFVGFDEDNLSIIIGAF